tara:strand:- start:6528 stop:7913 length:1386 start_codon:yes stop_codon:yes gene_type:complete
MEKYNIKATPLSDNHLIKENKINANKEIKENILYLKLYRKFNCYNTQLERATSKTSRATSKTSRATSKPSRAISKTSRATSKTSRATSKTPINKIKRPNRSISYLQRIDQGVEGGAGDEEEEPPQSLCTDSCDDRDCNFDFTPLFRFLWRYYVMRAPGIDSDEWDDHIRIPIIHGRNKLSDKTNSYKMKHIYVINRNTITTVEYTVKLRIRVEKDYGDIKKIIYSILIEYNGDIHLSYFYNYFPGSCIANVCAIHFTFNNDKASRLDYSYRFISDNIYKVDELNYRRSLILFALFLYKLAYYIANPDSLSGIHETNYSQGIKDWLNRITNDKDPLTGRNIIRSTFEINSIARYLCSIAIGIFNNLKIAGHLLDDNTDKEYIDKLEEVYSLDKLLSGVRNVGGKKQSDKITNYFNKIAKFKEDIKVLRKNKKLNKIDRKKELIEELKAKIKKEKEKLKKKGK